MNRRPWEVWFYAPEGRKLMERFNRRNDAEFHKAKLGRLLGKPDLLTVCFDPNESELPL